MVGPRKWLFLLCFFPVSLFLVARGDSLEINDWGLPENVLRRMVKDPSLAHTWVYSYWKKAEKKYGKEFGRELVFWFSSISPLVDFDGVRFCKIQKIPPKRERLEALKKFKIRYRGDRLNMLDLKTKEGRKGTFILWWGKEGWSFDAVKLIKDEVWLWVREGKKRKLFKIKWIPGKPPPPMTFWR